MWQKLNFKIAENQRLQQTIYLQFMTSLIQSS